MRARTRISPLMRMMATAFCLASPSSAPASESLAFRAPAAAAGAVAASDQCAARRGARRKLRSGVVRSNSRLAACGSGAGRRDGPADHEFAFEMLDARQRAFALALDDWNRAAPRGGERRRSRAAIVDYYAARDFTPLWQDEAGWRIRLARPCAGCA